jgi:cytidylate kinase
MKEGYSMVVITIGGGPGSGTTTVARVLREKLGIKYVYIGDLFRIMAQQQGLSLTDFGDYVFSHPEIDKQLDKAQVDIAKQGNVILEGRLAGWLIDQEGIPALKVWLTASPQVRAQRVAEREGKDINLVKEENQRRENQEHERYLKTYGFDLNRVEIYDLVIDTDDLTPQQIADIICTEANKMQ